MEKLKNIDQKTLDMLLVKYDFDLSSIYNDLYKIDSDYYDFPNDLNKLVQAGALDYFNFNELLEKIYSMKVDYFYGSLEEIGTDLFSECENEIELNNGCFERFFDFSEYATAFFTDNFLTYFETLEGVITINK